MELLATNLPRDTKTFALSLYFHWCQWNGAINKLGEVKLPGLMPNWGSFGY